mmetsp:Transcript_44947/g.143114  ORF Transcript_44947/g.143114 Transcript_44947/m.143114 type:complete len:497 (+) Transcript_44947:440-1930(+)
MVFSHKRTGAPLAAERLRVQLKGQLDRTTDANLKESLVRAIGLTNQFLYSRDASEEGLEGLKARVKKVLSRPAPLSPRSLSKASKASRTASVGTGASGTAKASEVPAAGGSTGKRPASRELPDIDWTLPPIANERLLRRANVPNEYLHMAKHFDDKHVGEDRARKVEERRKQAEVREGLSKQIEMQRQAKAQAEEAKRQVGMELKKQAQRYEDEEWHQQVAMHEKNMKNKAERELQVRDQADRAREARRLAKLEDEMLMAQIAEQDRKAAAKKAAELEADRVQMKKTMEDNIRNREMKQAAKMEEKNADELLMKRYVEIEEARAKAREDEIEARRALQLKKFQQGGGDALQASMEEKAAEDERKVLRLAAELEAAAARKDAEKKAKKRRDEEEMRNALAAQMRERDAVAQRDKSERKKYSEEMEDLYRRNKAEDAAAKKATREKKAALARDQVEQMKLEAHRRFYEAGDFMPERERKLNNDIFSMQIVGAALEGGR